MLVLIVLWNQIIDLVTSGVNLLQRVSPAISVAHGTTSRNPSNLGNPSSHTYSGRPPSYAIENVFHKVAIFDFFSRENRVGDFNTLDSFGWCPIERAIVLESAEITRILIQTSNGADLNVPNCGDGRTPLTLASVIGLMKITELLINSGADVNREDNHGSTPLISAISRGNLQIVKLLLRHGATLDLVSSQGWTAIIMAIYSEKIEIVKYLIDNGADLDVHTQSGWTPLTMAICKNRIDILKILIERGANVNYRPINANLALSKAIEKNDLDIVKILVENGANLNLHDKNGGTSLHNAIQQGDLRIVKYMKENGGNLNIKSLRNRYNSFELAFIYKEIDMLKQLLH